MHTHTSTRSRTRLLVLAVAVAAILGLVAWAVSSAVEGRSPGTAGADRAASASAAPEDPSTEPAASSTEEPAEKPAEEPAEEPAAEPTEAPSEMPDGTPIPAPSPGTPASLGEGATEAVEPVPVKAPVPLDETGDFGTGVTVALTGITSVQGVARAPGEISGPALEVTVEARNDSAEAIPLDGVVVFLSSGADRTPASTFREGSSPLHGELAAGATVTGTYVFAVPEDQRDDVRVEISYTGEAPTVAFAGSVA